MATLQGTTGNPSLLKFFTKKAEDTKSDAPETLSYLNQRKAQWERLQSLRAWSIVSDVVDPTITRFENELKESVSTMMRRMPVEVIPEYRAECRGALEAWTTMKVAVLLLSEEIDRLKGGMPSQKQVKNVLDQYK